jgi:hypothetical protein
MHMASTDYGPFAPVIGYAGAIMAAGATLFLLWGGKMRKWRPPEEDLPGTAQALVFLLCGVGMVLQWYFAVPESLEWFLGSVALLAVAAVLCFLRYNSLLGTYIYVKRIATGPTSVREVRILGGSALLPEAEKKRGELGIDVQRLLEGSAYNVDLLWSREARQGVKQRVVLFFILTLVFGTSALTGASFATQVLLTRKAAASTIRTTEAPGLLP